MELAGIPIEANAAQARHPAQQAVAGEVLVEPEHLLLESHGMSVGHHEGYIGRDRAYVADVVVEPLQFETD